jgi:hypothetical protein
MGTNTVIKIVRSRALRIRETTRKNNDAETIPQRMMAWAGRPHANFRAAQGQSRFLLGQGIGFCFSTRRISMPFSAGFSTHFDHLDGPRRAQGKMHWLGDILTIALCGVLAGAEGWEGLGTYARFKADGPSEQRLVLAQQKVDGKTNEIGTLPELLEAPDLQGCTARATGATTVATRSRRRRRPRARSRR